MSNAPNLSAVEGEILSAVANGVSTKEIANAMNTSHDTIDRALRKARDRFGAKNTTALVAFCIRNGILK